jgi:hypothetical protein
MRLAKAAFCLLRQIFVFATFLCFAFFAGSVLACQARPKAARNYSVVVNTPFNVNNAVPPNFQ